MATQAPDVSALPSAEPTDSEQVLRCIELARTLWEEGQHREAVRALQRGAEAAEEDGNDLRALSLARAAADLSAHVGAASVPPPPVEPEARPVPVPPPLPPEGAASPAPPAVREAPAPEASTAAPPSVAPSPAAAHPSVTPAHPSVTPAHPSATPAAPSVRSVPAAAARRSTGPVGPASKRPAPAAPTAPAAAEPHAKSTGVNGAPGTHAAREIRVAVRRSNLDEELYVVRPLRPGSKLPYGAEEAVLVFRDAETPGKEP